MFVRFDPTKHKGKQLYATKGRKTSDGMIEEVLTPIPVDPDLAAKYADKFYVWEGEGAPPGQGVG